jgi:hypothetical protein
MKHTEGTSCFSGFEFGIDFQEIMEEGIASFIDHVLIKQCPPTLHFARLHTYGDPVKDASTGYGQQPDNPLTLRLFIETFNPDDGSSIQFDADINEIIETHYQLDEPRKERFIELRNAFSKLVENMDEKISNWNPPQGDDEVKTI